MAANTTFVIVPGAWHPAVCFEAFARRLEGLGHQVRVVDHKSVGAEPPLQNFDPDVEQVHDIIEEESDKGQDVVVFMHSYGGLVGTEACRGLRKKAREATGKIGGVAKLIYCCAFIVSEGVSLFESIGGKPAGWITVSDNDTRADVENPESIFYNDMSPEHAADMKKHLKQHSNRVFMSKLTYAAYRDIPMTFILCTKDKAMPIVAQEGMVAQAKSLGADITTVTLEASHSPFFSMPDAVVAACQKVSA